jgi:sphinganine-1-phosphate aldolase
MGKFVVTNALHAEEFQMITQCEAEIIRMCCNMYHGDKDSCGLISSGGTESIILACLAARERAK